MSHSYVDVYFPRRAIAETELGLLPFQPPSSSSHRVDADEGTSPCTHGPRAKNAPSCSPMTGAATRWDVASESPSNATFHARYHPLDEIESFMRELAAAYPDQAAIVPLGHSGEGREMLALEISSARGGAGASGAGARDVSHDQNSAQVVMLDGKGKDEARRGTTTQPPRCGFLVTGAQHAREVSFFLVLPPLDSKNGVHWFTACSGLPLRLRCTSHTPSSLIRRRGFLSPVYLNDMYVQYVSFGKKANADQGLRISTLSLSRTQTDTYIHGKETDFGASMSLFYHFGST